MRVHCYIYERHPKYNTEYKKYKQYEKQYYKIKSRIWKENSNIIIPKLKEIFDKHRLYINAKTFNQFAGEVKQVWDFCDNFGNFLFWTRHIDNIHGERRRKNFMYKIYSIFQQIDALKLYRFRKHILFKQEDNLKKYQTEIIYIGDASDLYNFLTGGKKFSGYMEMEVSKENIIAFKKKIVSSNCLHYFNGLFIGAYPKIMQAFDNGYKIYLKFI